MAVIKVKLLSSYQLRTKARTYAPTYSYTKGIFYEKLCIYLITNYSTFYGNFCTICILLFLSDNDPFLSDKIEFPRLGLK